MNASSLLQGLWASRINVPPDLIQSLRGTETHTRNDYLGRVIFEFFQNAVDRAEDRIDITLSPAVSGDGSHTLMIANDGKPVSIAGRNEPASIGFPMVTGEMGQVDSCYGAEQRSDFQALCNIHNSNKHAGQSIGNKGVGFKSAWEFATRVTVASTLSDGSRYAFRFHQKLTSNQVRDQAQFWPSLDGHLREAAAALLDRTQDRAQGLPSFYFPEHVADAQACFSGRDWAKTVVVLEGIDGPGQTRLVERIAEFRQASLFFINQLRDRDGQKCSRDIVVSTQVDEQVQRQSTRVPDGWTVVDEGLLADLWPEQSNVLRKAASSLNFSIAQPSLALAFPPERQVEDSTSPPDQSGNRFFCYLPTYVDCGFGVQIHADFMLDMSRKNIEVTQNPYNKALVHLAGRLLGRALRTLPALQQRVDVMGFLLPGKANNPAADELRRGLARELHLPVESDTAEPATLRDFLITVYPPTRSGAWPELRYTHTLDFLRAWCAPRAYEREKAHQKRTAPYINLFREQQTRILPERVESGVVKVALPLPLVDAGDRLRGGRGIFWRRKAEQGQMLDLGGLSLADTGIDGLAITEWDKLNETDQNLLGTLTFNLSEIAYRLRLRMDELLQGQTLVGSENLPFRPGAVLRFVANLLSRSEQTVVDRIVSMGFLADAKGNADNLSRILLPVMGGGWRIGREVILPDAVPNFGLLVNDYWNSASVLDMERFKSSVGLMDDEPARQLVQRLGAWPCLPLRQDGEVWSLPLKLSGLQTTEQKASFYSAYVRAWTQWVQAAPAVAAQVAETLRTSAVDWLPLEADYNTAENICARPSDVLLVNERDRTRQSFLLKKVAVDASEEAALQAISVVAAADASVEKLLSLLAFMGKGNPSDEIMRGRYRSLVLELGRRDAWATPSEQDRQWLKTLPLLVSEKSGRKWMSASQAKATWFVPRIAQHLRSEFRAQCTFLEFDPDTRTTLVEQVLGARRFEPKLKMGSGNPAAPNTALPAPCRETRERLQNRYLADLMLIAESANIGGGFRTREAVKEDWLRLVLRQGERVWILATLDGQQLFIGEEVERRDVLLNDTGGQLEIWHDIPLDQMDANLHLFAEPLAIGVFGNRMLTDAFAVYLGAGEQQAIRLADRYGITEDERLAARNYLISKFLSGKVLDELIQVLCALPEWCGRAIDPDELRERWWDVHFYLENKLALDHNALRARLTPQLRDIFPAVNPTPINQRHWEQSFDSQEIHLALLTEFIDRRAGGEFETSGLTEFFRKLPATVSRFDFDPIVEQRKRLGIYGSATIDYRQWCQEKKKSLNWMSAMYFVAGDIADVSILANPLTASELNTATIRSVQRTGTRSAFKTSPTEREQGNRRNQQAGLTAELRVVLESTANLLSSANIAVQWNAVLVAWTEVQKEVDKLPMLPPICPADTDQHQVAAMLHSAKFAGDGLGFDVIEVGNQPGQVWLAEVKSATGGKLFLSENERLKALRYEARRPGLWKLKVWMGNGQWAGPQLTVAVMDAFKYIDAHMQGNDTFQAEGWVFQLTGTDPT